VTTREWGCILNDLRHRVSSGKDGADEQKDFVTWSKERGEDAVSEL
jgi:hypothetical protein